MEVAIAEDPRPLRSHLFRRPAQSRDAGGVTAAPADQGRIEPVTSGGRAFSALSGAAKKCHLWAGSVPAKWKTPADTASAIEKALPVRR
jgi:hypothetical protein